MTLHVSPQAKADLAHIWRETATRWSLDQADRYRQYLTERVHAHLETPTLGTPVVGHPGLRSLSLSRRKLRDGHPVLYRIEDAQNEIVILRFFHTKQNWPEQI